MATLALWVTPQAFSASSDRVRNPGEYLMIHPVQYGTASWYGGRAQGRLMASGERFNEYALTAAHRTLPLGTEVKVTNLHNGRSVIVRIKDRGPAIRSRVIDLSKAAAVRLGFTHRGLAPVKVQVVSLPPAKEHPAAVNSRVASVERNRAASHLPASHTPAAPPRYAPRRRYAESAPSTNSQTFPGA